MTGSGLRMASLRRETTAGAEIATTDRAVEPEFSGQWPNRSAAMPRAMRIEIRRGLMKGFSRVALVLAIAFMLVGPATAGVRVSLQPASNHVLPGRDLNIYVYVDSAGSPFNGYETVIRWDPGIVEFLSAQPDTLYGEHNYDWFRTEVGPDSILISHVILQGGMTVTGPGALSSITLHTVQVGQSPVYFEYIKFYKFGFDVTPVWSHDAVVYVENPNSGVLDPGGGNRRLETVLVSPNPVNEGSVLVWPREIRSDAVLRLFDVEGRLLQARRVERASPRSTLGSIIDLHSLPQGSFFLEIAGADVRMRARFTRLRE